MNDDFEKRLQAQPVRKVPTEWRAEILQRATVSSSPVTPRLSFLSTIHSQLSAILWPHPKAWAALAAVWVAIFALQFGSRQDAPRMAKASVPRSQEILVTFGEQQKVLAELMGADAQPREMERPKRLPPQPHSERRQTTSMA